MLRRVLVAVGMLVVLWLVAVAALFVWPPGDSGAPARADVVVVLSGGRNTRLDPALKLMRRSVAPVLAISGGLTDPIWKKARRLCLRQDGPVRFRVLCFQASPYSTRGEAETVTRLAHRYGWDRIVVVTSTYHVTRARMLFRRCFHGSLWMVGASAPLKRLPQEWAFETGKLLVQTVFERGC